MTRMTSRNIASQNEMAPKLTQRFYHSLNVFAEGNWLVLLMRVVIAPAKQTCAAVEREIRNLAADGEERPDRELPDFLVPMAVVPDADNSADEE